MPSFSAAPVRAGTAWIDIQRTRGFTRWIVGNDRITCTLGVLADGILQVEAVARTDNLGAVARAARDVFAITLDDERRLTATGAKVVGDATAITGSGVRLEIELEADGAGTVRFAIELPEHQAVLRQGLSFTAADETTVTGCEPLVLGIGAPSSMLLQTVAGVQQQGGWRPESVGPYRTFRLESRELDQPALIHSGPRSTWDETPWAAIGPRYQDDGIPGGILFAFDYGGQWELAARPDDGGPTELAFAAAGIEPRLQPGETWTAPATWIGSYPGDLDSAARIWVDYLRAHVVPAQPDDFPWVQYNTWYSYHCDLDADRLLEEADIAAALGVEVFYIDAGWWTGNPMRRDNFGSGLGNWTENRDKFPDGIAAFADRIRERGMHFGIWVEPERVDLRTATTGTWQTAWLATRDSELIGPEWPRDTSTAWLCFGHPEAQAWAIDWIGAMIAAYGVRWLKWDSNHWGVCTNPDHGHGATDGEAAQLEGVYRVMDALRERFPDLVIENCAGGGTRMDFAIARHSHAWWVDDASEPGHRVRFHASGAGYLYPLETLNSWVTESDYESVNGRDLPDPVLRAVFRSRMIGALGISCQLVTWSEATRLIVAEELARYKAVLRPLVRSGHLAHLLPQPDLVTPVLAPPPSWEAFQIGDGEVWVVLGFRNLAVDDAQRVFLKGLQPGVTYELADETGASLGTAAGSDLMETGWSLACAPLCSTWMTISAS